MVTILNAICAIRTDMRVTLTLEIGARVPIKDLVTYHIADRNYAYDPADTGVTVNQQSHKMKGGQLWRQYIIAANANLAITSIGYCLGWTAPINSKLTDPVNSPLGRPATTEEIAWIGSLLSIGAIFGPFFGGLTASKIGRKWGLMSATIPLFIGWIMIAVATSIPLLYAARIIWGVAVGMLFTITPMYCGEIATDDSRGALGSFLQAFITLGYLLIYVVGPFVSYYVVAYVGLAFVAIFAITFFFMPESPTYYLLKDDREGAAECLEVLRGRPRADIESELNLIASDVAASRERTATISDVFRGGNFKAFYISCMLVFFQQFCGINAVLFYLTDIFNASGTSLDSDIATIIVGAVQVVCSSMTPFVVDRLGRRILMLISSCGTAIGMGLLGMFFLLDRNDSPVVESISFLPVLSLVLFIVMFCWGLGPLPWAIIGELFPIEVKAVATPIVTAFCWILSFLITYFFPSISDSIGMHVGFFIFGGCCVGSFFFSLLLLPETKGKSFQEIQIMLGGGQKPEKA